MTDRISSKQYRTLAKRSNKYGAKRIRVNGHTFDSKREADRYKILKAMQMAREISELELQPQFPFMIGGKPVLMRSKGFPNGRRVKYVADFRYKDADGNTVIEDVKGYATDVYKLKKAVVEAIYGIKVVEV